MHHCAIPPPTELWVLQYHHNLASFQWTVHHLTNPCIPLFLNGAWQISLDPLTLYCYPPTSATHETLGFLLVHSSSVLTATPYPNLLKLQEQQHPLQSSAYPIHIHTPYGCVHLTTPSNVHTTLNPHIPAGVLIYRDYPCQFNPLLDAPQPSFFAPSQPLLTWMPCTTATVQQNTLTPDIAL